MKRKLVLLLLLFLVPCSLASACNAENAGDVKTLTKPYVASYVCTKATLNGRDLLQDYAYVTVTFLDDERLSFTAKTKQGELIRHTLNYTYDEDTQQLHVEGGIFGATQMQPPTIANGRFTIAKKLGDLQFLMIFEAK